MRNAMALISIISVFAIWGCGSGNKQTAAPVEAPAPHNTSSMERAFVGHWVTDDHKTHYYITRDKIITVDITEVPYSVSRADKENDSLALKVWTISGWHEQVFSFSKDRNSMTKKFKIGDSVLKTNLNYVDSRVQP